MKFIKHIIFIILLTGCFNEGESIPTYLEDYNELYLENPREANLTWFKDSKFGMFIHYGLYSQLEKGEWIQLRDTIEVSEYAKLNKPLLGICLGMQIALIEFARNMLGLKGANSTEFDKKTSHPVIDLMESQRAIRRKGGTMRLGAYSC